MIPIKLRRVALAAVFLALIFAVSGCVVRPVQPTGGVAVQYDYYYYPDADVYYSISTGYYYYLSGGVWLRVHTLPRYYRLNPRSRVRIQAPRHRPYEHHREHRRIYRPQPGNERDRGRNHNGYPGPGPDRDQGRNGYPNGNHGRDGRGNHNGQPGGMPGPDSQGQHRNGSGAERAYPPSRDNNAGRYQRNGEKSRGSVKPQRDRKNVKNGKNGKNGKQKSGYQKGTKKDKNGKDQKEDDSNGSRPTYR